MKRICLTLLPILALAVPSTQAAAQSWPTRPIRAIVPYTAGSGTDVTARVILNQLSSELGQSIVVENRVGAGGTIGTTAAAKAEPDGYTILVQSSALTIAPSIYQNLAYDTARDLAAVTPLGISPNVLIISPARGIKTIHELVSAAKAKPGSLTFASAGVGTNTHLSAERFRLRAGFEAIHVAAYSRGQARRACSKRPKTRLGCAGRPHDPGSRLYRLRLPYLVGDICSREDAP
jgi:tripartite-type tricarboxylate transporter receptor subunit TctC